MLSYLEILSAVRLCQTYFGASSVRVSDDPSREQEIILTGHTPRLPATADAWARARRFADMSGPVLGLCPIRRSDASCSEREWAAAYEFARTWVDPEAAPAPVPAPVPAPASPAYGPAGKPSPGRLVRLHILGGVPAVIHRVLDESCGRVVVIYDDIWPQASMDGDPLPVLRQAVVTTYGTGPGQWDYWPRV